MATAAIIPGPRRSFGDAGSLRSFRGAGSSSKAHSLKTRSLKAKKSLPMPMPSLIGLKRVGRRDSSLFRSGITDKDFNTATPEPVMAKNSGVATPPSRPSEEVENVAQPKNGSNPLQRPNSKSRTIIRIISTKFRSRSPPPTSPLPPHSPGRVPAAPADLISKENREAALRERGLLPPLPTKDLSLIEREQDQHIPVVALGDKDTDAAVTAASLVKQEWEAKHRTEVQELAQRERMSAFKFGGSSQTPSVQGQTRPSTELDTVEEVDSALPSPVKGEENGQNTSTPDQLSGAEASGSPTLHGSIGDLSPHTLGIEADIVNNDQLPSSLGPTTPAQSSPEPHLIPLPPSPFSSPLHRPQALSVKTDGVADPTYLSAASIPLPPSPCPSVILDTGKLEENRPPPTISLSPPMSHADFLQGLTFGENSDVLSPTFTKPLLMSESGSDSTTTPTMDVSSHTMTASPLSTPEPSPSAEKGKPNGLKLNVHDHNIPIIVESSIEENPEDDALINTGLVHDEPEMIEQEEEDEARSPTTPQSPDSNQPPRLNRRITLNPFKRGRTLEPSSPPGSSGLARRVSVAASINNIRRSVVGSLSRPRATSNNGHKTFDASHLPASPTIPSSFADQINGPRSPTSPTSPTRPLFPSRTSPALALPPRQAVSPVIHSQGSILMETNNIEDEETRRMTELAFLG